MLVKPASAEQTLRSPVASYALVTIHTVMDLTGLGEDGALALADSGEILAFDLRTPRSRRRLLRFHWKNFLLWWNKTPVQPPADLDAVTRAVLGTPRDGIALSYFARALRCSTEHIRDLVKARQLKLISRPHRGPNGSPKICYQSAAAFLRSARVI